MIEVDHAEYVTRSQAAAAVDVEPETVRSWERRGHLPVAARVDGTVYYRLRDVQLAERNTRASPTSTRRKPRTVLDLGSDSDHPLTPGHPCPPAGDT